MNMNLNNYENIFFVGIAGVGMSALAQYLKNIGKNVSGSDRYFTEGTFNEIKNKLETEDIHCFEQNGEGINETIDLVILSTAVDDTVAEVQKAKKLNITIMKRSELLALIATTKKTIAIGGTCGKSTTVAMLFEILVFARYEPGLISGAGLTPFTKQNKIGNAKVGKGEWLIIEADESDGTIVQYKPELGILLNIDKDHKELTELVQLFTQFKENSKLFSVNKAHPIAGTLSKNAQYDFSSKETTEVGYVATHFQQDGFVISFKINNTNFSINTVGKHNMENALAAVTAANLIGIDLNICANALKQFEGIYRRHQIIGKKNGILVIDDFAHNPAKCAASIRACQPVAKKLIAWHQLLGYARTKFLRDDFVKEIGDTLRSQDEIWMSEIFYVGNIVVKDVSANDLINDLKDLNKNAFYIEDRNNFPEAIQSHLTDDCCILLMGARDPTLEQYAQYVLNKI